MTLELSLRNSHRVKPLWRYHSIGALNDFFPVKQLFEEANTAYKFLGPVVQKVDSGIHWRDKSLSEDKAIGLRNTYTLERGWIALSTFCFG